MIVIVIILVVLVGGSLGYLTLSSILTHHAPATVTTWSMWGMSIDHPTGLEDKYSGLLETAADSDSGGVAWTWNGGNTSLALFWLPANAYNYTAGFEGIEGDIEGAVAAGSTPSSSNLTFLTNGNVTIDGNSWPYRTYNAEVNGGQYYWAVTLCFYQNETRVYSIEYFDTSQDVLDPMIGMGDDVPRIATSLARGRRPMCLLPVLLREDSASS